jgi:hypothetical protein
MGGEETPGAEGLVVDWIAATIIAVEIVAGVQFHA